MSFSKLLYILDSCTLFVISGFQGYFKIMSTFSGEKICSLDWVAEWSYWCLFSHQRGGALQHPTQSLSWSSQRSAQSPAWFALCQEALLTDAVAVAHSLGLFPITHICHVSLSTKPIWLHRLVLSPNFLSLFQTFFQKPSASSLSYHCGMERDLAPLYPWILYVWDYIITIISTICNAI